MSGNGQVDGQPQGFRREELAYACGWDLSGFAQVLMVFGET
jgi:hypothetical protein